MSKCTACGDKPENTAKDFTKAVIEINNPETLVLLRKVVIPASMGDDTDIVPAIGKYRNVILQYEANGHIYLYSSDGIPTAIEANIPQEVLDQIAELENDVDSLERADQGLQQEIDELKNSPDVVDIVATYADLQAYDTSTLGDKDVIRVLEDETHNNESAYYRWDKTNSQWVFIGAVEGYYTKDQTDDLLDAKQDLLTPGENITIEDESGALVISATDTKYTAGSNVQISPQNVISATDTTYPDFTGTDGTTAGAAGLVPAPATTDAGKFLKADGTWDTAGGGGVTELTTADYNYPTDNPTSIALWLLDDGVYEIKTSIATYANATAGVGRGAYIITTDSTNGNKQIVRFYTNNDIVYVTNASTGAEVSQTPLTTPVVQTTGTSTTSVMSQDAVTSMVFSDPSTQRIVRIGNANTSGSQSVSIGVGAGASVNESIAIGANAMANGPATLALGSSSTATQAGEISFPYCRSGGASGVVNFGPYNASFGYNNSKYRLLTGLYDGQSAHDAATKGQLDSAVNTLETELDAKQDILTAGQNITIAEESGALVISATGGSGADVFTTNEWNALWA